MDEWAQSVDYSEPDSSVSERVVEAVATEADADPEDLTPLYYSVDPESLDSLFGDDGSNRRQDGCRVTFRHAGHRVAVSRDGSVTVASEAEATAWQDTTLHPDDEPDAHD